MATGRKSLHRVHAVAVLSLVASVLAIALLTRSAPLDAQSAAIRTATEGALRSLYEDDIPPGTYEGGPLSSPTAADMRARANADFDRYFTPRLQARYRPMILAVVDQIGASEWDASVTEAFEWDGIRISGDRATAHVVQSIAVLRRGGQFGTRSTDSHRLEAINDWKVTLVLTAGNWLVDEIDVQCRSGCP
jgi:hypothetical protein